MTGRTRRDVERVQRLLGDLYWLVTDAPDVGLDGQDRDNVSHLRVRLDDWLET